MAELTELMKRASMLAVDLITSGGVITDDIAKALDSPDLASNESVQSDFFGFVLHSAMMQAELANARVKQWQSIEGSSTEAMKALKLRMKIKMEMLGKTEIIGEQSRFDLIPARPQLIVSNQKAVPPEFITTEYLEPIKKLEAEKILEELTNGRPVPGCELSKDTLLVHRVTLKEV